MSAGKRRFSTKLWIGVLSLLCVCYLAFGDFARKSPGPLTTVHGRIDELSGWNSCAQCHGGMFGSMTKSCLECHEDVQAQIDGHHGLHGSIEQEKAQRCAVCHSEHHGPDFQMVNRNSFAQMGFAEITKFDHASVGFEMRGKHLTLECATCHENADAQVLPEGQKRFLGKSQDCATCHDDPHQGRMSMSCADCHSQDGFDVLEARGHDRHLRLVGAHARASCRDCHEQGTSHSLESYGGRSRPPEPRTCTSCHDSPHGEAFVLGNARASKRDVDASCAICHVDEHTSFRDEGLSLTHAQHAHSGFRLDAPHAQLRCEQCHDKGAASFRDRHPGRAQDSCQACHEDPHGGQFRDSPHGSNGCLSCHERERFEPHAFTLARHAETKMPLTGRHEETKCEACHDKVADAPRGFRGTERRCEACHSDAHRGFFDRFAKELEENDRGNCATCHDTHGFAAKKPQEFDHERWTGFPLRGAHAQERCETCHPRMREPDAHGRSFGFCAGKFGAIPDSGRSCVPCHDDPHGGEFDRPGLPAQVAGRKSCARCHTETSFRALATDFDHKLWTGFELIGRHADAACTSCHTPDGIGANAAGRKIGRAWGSAKGRDCADCHEDSHQGQFAVLGKTDCAKCHREHQSFLDLRFKHDIHSRFKLGEQHRRLACSKCHRTERREVARKKVVSFVRYKPLGRECSDCHENRARPFPRRPKKRR